MARTSNLTDFLTDVANAIREKKGTTDTIAASNFDTEIANLPSGGSGNIVTFIETPTKISPYKNIDIVIRENVPDYGFYANTILNNVTFDEGVTSIGSYAFAMPTSSFVSAYINELPSTLTSIGTNAFQNNNNLTITSVPSGVTRIEDGALSYCTNLTEITLLGDINYIGWNAFRGDTSLAKVSLPNITSIPELNGTNAFMSTPIANGTGYIYIADDLVEKMKTATNWSTYADQIKPLSELESE